MTELKLALCLILAGLSKIQSCVILTHSSLVQDHVKWLHNFGQLESITSLSTDASHIKDLLKKVKCAQVFTNRPEEIQQLAKNFYEHRSKVTITVISSKIATNQSGISLPVQYIQLERGGRLCQVHKEGASSRSLKLGFRGGKRQFLVLSARIREEDCQHQTWSSEVFL